MSKTDLPDNTDSLVAEKLFSEVELYQYMVLKPLELIHELVNGEHFQAAGVALTKIHKDAADFSLRLTALAEGLRPVSEPQPVAQDPTPVEK